ncbi:hypothetical protein FS749_002359 [Ceratobasidium sp. UAMH 11750]|nr:hypothetical protein FS749_002359 [Ceratobasidium sp. UAMH 11750]
MKVTCAALAALFGLPALAELAPRQSNTNQSEKYVPSPGSPGFYAGKSKASVTFDQHSLMLNGKRIMAFSGEFHPWRLPSVPLWRDVLEKMKAGGFNTVAIYTHWGLTEGKQGKLNFEGFRSITKFLDIAKSVGILVIFRPGPYINAETTSGGLPAWVSNLGGLSRSDAPEFTEAWKPYIIAASKYIAPYQYPDGPVILVQSENEFNGDDPRRRAYMRLIEETMRANGVTKVPLTHNDWRAAGQYASGEAKVDLYGWDGYPAGFDCSNPNSWKEVDSGLDEAHQRYNPAEPLYLAEYQGGSYDPWNGPGYNACYNLTNDQFANVFYKNNYAAGTYIQSLYMTYGGTNWGNLATPKVYTSYDYGAAISEDRSLTPKFSEIKLQALFLHASPNYHLAGRIGTGTGSTNSDQIFTTNLATLSGQSFYIVRQTTNSNTNRVEFKLKVNTKAGNLTIPQYGGSMALDGRESKIVVTEYPFGRSSVLRYTTAEVATWATFDGADHIVLYAKSQAIEAVVPTNATSATSSASTISARVANGTAIITGTAPASGLAVVKFGKIAVWIADKTWLAPRIWAPRVGRGTSGNGQYDLGPRTDAVWVFGPYLVRKATIAGSTVALTGDLKSGTTTVEVLAPSFVQSVTWNGRSVRVFKTAIGTLKGTVGVANLTPKLPSLKNLEWRCIDSLPEVAPEFDDSKWTVATKTSTKRPWDMRSWDGKWYLYGDEYGYHQGNLLYRGRFDGYAWGMKIYPEGGDHFGYSIFFNGAFLESGQGGRNSDHVTRDIGFPDELIKRDGTNVVTVLVDNMGLEDDWSLEERFKIPRGIRGYKLYGGGDFTSWKLIGNVEGEDTTDIARGPLNTGGLYVERIGAIYPNYKFTSAWNSSKTDASCTPFAGIGKAGVKAYKAKFRLNIDKATDAPIAFKFERTPSSNYRVMLYVNGWQFGRFTSNFGPQTVYPIPEGILNHRGENDVLMTLWSLDGSGAKVANVELVSTSVVESSKEVVVGLAA